MLFLGCLGSAGYSQTETQKAGKEPTGEKSMQKLSADDFAESAGKLLEGLKTFNYQPKNKRDPFQPYFGLNQVRPGSLEGPVQWLQRFDLDQIKLTGIIWDVGAPRAMVQDPKGGVHVVTKDAKIGRNNGYIAVIREGEIVIVEPFEDAGKLSYTTRVLTMEVK